MKISIIGTQGLPAKYGGFESLVKNLVNNLEDEFDITVFCSSPIYKHKLSHYSKSKLKYINFRPNGFQSIFYDIFSILHSINNFDKILILGASGGIILPFLSNYSHKFILNFGGLDWKRSKWSFFTRQFLKFSEKIAVKYSNIIIADNPGISEYIIKNYNRKSILIEYGGDHALNNNLGHQKIKKNKLLPNKYCCSVARIQKDNNIEIILKSFININGNLVIVGNWNYSDYGKKMKLKYSRFKNIFMLDPIYDINELNCIRSNCQIYIHGHSAGGTNPALVEAMALGLPVACFSNVFNKYTTNNLSLYFKNSNELQKIIFTKKNKLKSIAKKLKDYAQKKYNWDRIAQKYKEVFYLNVN